MRQRYQLIFAAAFGFAIWGLGYGFSDDLHPWHRRKPLKLSTWAPPPPRFQHVYFREAWSRDRSQIVVTVDPLRSPGDDDIRNGFVRLSDQQIHTGKGFPKGATAVQFFRDLDYRTRLEVQDTLHPKQQVKKDTPNR